jgi:hypothetical protein
MCMRVQAFVQLALTVAWAVLMAFPYRACISVSVPGDMQICSSGAGMLGPKLVVSHVGSSSRRGIFDSGGDVRSDPTRCVLATDPPCHHVQTEPEVPVEISISIG